MTISTPAQMAALVREAEEAPARGKRVEMFLRAERPAAARITLTIPPPADGCTYSIAEVAALCHVAEATVRRWAAPTGCDCAGRHARLETLAAPRGRVAPEALCRFLSRVNQIDVSVAHPPSRDTGAARPDRAAPDLKPNGASPGIPPCNCPPGPPRASFGNGSPQGQGGTEP